MCLLIHMNDVHVHMNRIYIAAVAAGVLSNLALNGRLNGGNVCAILVAHGALSALAPLLSRPVCVCA